MTDESHDILSKIGREGAADIANKMKQIHDWRVRVEYLDPHLSSLITNSLKQGDFEHLLVKIGIFITEVLREFGLSEIYCVPQALLYCFATDESYILHGMEALKRLTGSHDISLALDQLKISDYGGLAMMVLLLEGEVRGDDPVETASLLARVMKEEGRLQ